MSFSDPTPMEKGYPAPPLPEPGQFTPNSSHWVTPDYERYLNQINFLSRTYFWTHDEALKNSHLCNTDAMWADPIINSAIRDRQRPVVQLEWQLEPRNPTDPIEKQLAQDITEIIEDIPNLQQLRRCLLDALWWGRSAVELVFDWDFTINGQKRMIVRDWNPIHGDSLVFKWDGTLGYLVGAQMAGREGVHPIEGRGGLVRFLTQDQEQCVLVHKFEPMPADYFKPEMAGSIKGTGYRGRVYWYWWLKHNLMRIMFDFLRKVGNGFFLAGYAAGNRTELANMKAALEQQEGASILYVPVDQNRTLEDVLKHLPVSMQGADFQWTIIQSLNEIIRQTILGEEGTTRSMPTGLGSGQSSSHGMTADERVKYDAVDLETPMQKLVNVIARYMKPGVRPPRFQHLADKREPGEVMAAVSQALQWGLTIPKTWVQEQLGIPEPNEGDETLSLIQQQQAAALNAAPAGVPMEGQPGPAAGPAPDGAAPAAGPDQASAAESGETAALAAQIQPMAG